jgi:2-oxoglutarate dehydrogenase E2 component (dihydrolipoamide succinyltransferase)
MPAVPITVPGVGESIAEGILAKWLKPDGAAVKEGEPLFELETDKASTDVPSPLSGVLKIGVAEGTTVEIGATVGKIDTDAAAAPVPSSAAASPPSSEGGGTDGSEVRLSPAARRIVTEEKLDPAAIAASGQGGLITKSDVLTHLAAPPAPPKPDIIPAAPPPGAEPLPAPIQAPSASRPAGPQRESRKRMSGIRQKIAQRLVEAQQTAAILTTFNEADMTRVMDLRGRYKDAFKAQHHIALGFMSFFVKAVIEALKAFPAVNARVDGQDIVYQTFYDVGVAVSSERGLMVPVIRDADKIGFAAIEKAIATFAQKARDNTIAVGDLQGGTFTITNGGVFGSLLSTPILNPPQSGILGMHAIQKRPVAVDDQVVIRPMMYLALSYDHRIIDGREAVGFLMRVKECVENPERLMLEI